MSMMRVYFLDPSNHIVRGDWIDCADDTDACRAAAQLIGDYAAVEVWEQARQVGRIDRREATGSGEPSEATGRTGR